ncbi:hypothetical protein C2G38_2227971 [Gigaspora rosea]|uniref:NYN domain-containing protein n=1 Tax=Gigaspora rosea TaxID=44941 RepID=A0A397TYB1_9GLOM|nr:hypothetical protein C2G38_2227971 [Gigaspora rosea]
MTVYDHIVNKEKNVDMRLGASIMDVVPFMDTGVILWVVGDSDYSLVLKRALNYNWKVEIWFDPHKGKLQLFYYSALCKFYIYRRPVLSEVKTKRLIKIKKAQHGERLMIKECGF